MRLKPRPARHSKRPRPSHRGAKNRPTPLAIEQLEERSLLSVTVTTVADENDGPNVGGMSLREAIAAAAAGETIDFAPSLTSGGPATVQLAHGALLIDKPVQIVGPGADLLTIDAGQLSRVFSVTTTGTTIDVSLAAMKVTRGISQYSQDGGGIFSSHANLTIEDCTITANVSGPYGDGAGIYHEVGDLTINNSRITGNFAGVIGQGGDGAGVFHKSGTLIVEGSTISGNNARGYSGGGIYTREATSTLSNSIIESNSTRGDGGGVYKYLGNLTVQSSAIRNNTGGGSGNSGGGILNLYGLFLVSDSTITGNLNGDGGGISNYDGAMTIARSTISHNTASGGHGGGIENDTSGLVALTESVLDGNSAVNGGGLWSYRTLTIDATTISGNAVAVSGGGIDVPGGTLSRSTVSGNSAGQNGGGIAAAGSFVIASSTISGNSAGALGGGIYSSAFALSLKHTTITANKASAVGAAGGGVYASSPSGLDLDHTIIAGNLRLPENASDEVRGGFDFGGPFPGGPPPMPFDVEIRTRYSLIGDDTGTTIVDLGGNLVGHAGNPIDPLLAALANNGGPTWTHEPLQGSPAIGSGDPQAIAGAGSVPAYDQRGAPYSRIFGDRIDIGAIELQPDPVSTIAGRHIFYNQSAWDGTTAASGLPINFVSDELARAPDKTAYLPGDPTAVAANMTNYSRGITGIMIDLSTTGGSHAAISASDFVFKASPTGGDNTPNSWAAAPAPTSVAVSLGGGVGGTDRVEITWSSTISVKNAWLEVQVLATANTGLAATDVFFWGNKIGDRATGALNASNFITNTTDAAQVNATLVAVAGAAITNPGDFNRDKGVTTTDASIVNASLGNLNRLNVGGSGPFAPEGGGGDGDSSGDAGIASALANSSGGASRSSISSQAVPVANSPRAGIAKPYRGSGARIAAIDVALANAAVSENDEAHNGDSDLEELLNTLVAGM